MVIRAEIIILRISNAQDQQLNQPPSTFTWDSDFITGIESVDEQHRGLVGLFNRLSAEITSGDDKLSALDEILTELTRYSTYHFTEEVRLMISSGLDPTYIESHVRAHKDFTAQIGALAASPAVLAERPAAIVDFLVAWLGHHILGEDQVMARQIALINQGMTAERANAKEATGVNPVTDTLLKAMRNLYAVVSNLNNNLASANRELEDRVGARTAELDLANEQLRQANRRLTILSKTDGLLGIANRAHLDEALPTEWRRAMRSTTSVAFLLADIDYFKPFNDSYGHLSGDECLKSVAHAITAQLNRPADLVARYGGDELAILLPDTDLVGAQAIARNLCDAVAGLAIPHSESPYGHVTLSIGAAAVVPQPDGIPEDLIGAADGALYAAKEAGRNQVSLAA